MRQKLVKLVILVVVVALATHAATALAACCSITSVNPSTGLVKAREGAAGRTYEFTVTDASQRSSLRVGQAVEADFGAQTAWVPPLTARYRISNLSSAAQGLAAPGAIVKPVALPELLSVILWMPQINLAGPQPAQQAGAVPGGTEARGTVFLTAPAVGNAQVALASGNTALLHAPPSVTVAAGAQSAQFRYDPLPVAAPTAATVSASYRGQTKTASVTILPPQVQAITLDPAQLLGGQPTRGIVTLSGRGPSGLRVVLASNNPAAQVPAEVSLSGTQQTSFTITTRPVGQQTPILISASLAGSKRDSTLTVMPGALRVLGWYQIQANNPVWWASNRCYPQGQVGPMNFSGRIMLAAELTGPAPADQDVVIKLKSSNPHLLPVPPALTIPRNGVRVESQLTCPSPNAQSQVDITGSYLGQAKIYQVTVKPEPPQPDLQLLAITFQDSAGNAIPRPTNPQAFRGCATFALHHADIYTAYSSTKLRFAYQHSRGATAQADSTESLLLPVAGGGGQVPPSGQSFGPRCHSVPGLEVGEYVDITFTLDPDNVQTESSEWNNREQLRVTR